MSAKHNQGPWRRGKDGGSVVVDAPLSEIKGDDVTAYYGGHLIAESISPRNMPLILAAPDLYEACKAQRQAIDRLFAMLIEATKDQKPHCFFATESGQPWKAVLQGNKAIAKAEGQE